MSDNATLAQNDSPAAEISKKCRLLGKPRRYQTELAGEAVHFDVQQKYTARWMGMLKTASGSPLWDKPLYAKSLKQMLSIQGIDPKAKPIEVNA